MKTINLSLFVHIYLIGIAVGQNVQEYTFQQYVKQYNKTYINNDDYLMHKNVFNRNVAKFKTIQSQLGIEAGINKFTDRTQQQIKQMRNHKITPLSRTQTPHFSIPRKLGGLSSLDWRTRGAISPVKDQGPCGSCWAFATAAYCESSLIINDGAKNNIDLSEQYLLQCTPQSDCKGGYPAYALLQVVSHGIPKQQIYLYDPLNQHEGICQTNKVMKVKGKQVYVYFSLNDLQLIYLLHSSPVIVGVGSADWEFYKGGIMKCKPNITQDHAVLLVGYTPQYWIVKNHWGPDWGQKGFIRISRNKQNNCLMGIQVDVLYSESLRNLFIGLVSITILIFS